MMRYRLRTLMIALAIAPPVLAVAWFLLRSRLANPPPPEPVLFGVVMYCAVGTFVYWLHASA
jgi:hypothetical protein